MFDVLIQFCLTVSSCANRFDGASEKLRGTSGNFLETNGNTHIQYNSDTDLQDIVRCSLNITKTSENTSGNVGELRG